MSLLVILFCDLHSVVETFMVSEGSEQEFSKYFLDFRRPFKKHLHSQLLENGPSKVLRLPY